MSGLSRILAEAVISHWNPRGAVLGTSLVVGEYIRPVVNEFFTRGIFFPNSTIGAIADPLKELHSKKIGNFVSTF